MYRTSTLHPASYSRSLVPKHAHAHNTRQLTQHPVALQGQSTLSESHLTQPTGHYLLVKPISSNDFPTSPWHALSFRPRSSLCEKAQPRRALHTRLQVQATLLLMLVHLPRTSLPKTSPTLHSRLHPHLGMPSSLGVPPHQRDLHPPLLKELDILINFHVWRSPLLLGLELTCHTLRSGVQLFHAQHQVEVNAHSSYPRSCAQSSS